MLAVITQHAAILEAIDSTYCQLILGYFNENRPLAHDAAGESLGRYRPGALKCHIDIAMAQRSLHHHLDIRQKLPRVDRIK
jgi:hypothetical protein